jgi:hypothetical protein
MTSASWSPAVGCGECSRSSPARLARNRTARLRFKFAPPGTPRLMLLPRKLLGLIYVAIGVFVASSKDYLDNLDTVKRVLSALLAILLWPLLLLGIDLHVR